MDTDSPRLRLSIIAVVVLSLFGALFARLWYLQVMVADQYQLEASANRVRTVAEEAPRGRILDAKGRVLVDNRISRVVTVDPYVLKQQLKTTAEQEDLKLRLAEKLTEAGIPTKVASIDRRLGDPQYPQLQPIPIAIDVPEELYLYLSERAEEYPSVAVVRQSVRQYYPELANAAHVLGYVGRISPDELKAKQGTAVDPKPIDKPYQPSSNIGKTGVERDYEDELRGTPGIQTIEVDSKGTPIRVVSEQAPRPGNDIQLTIDADVQRSAEDALAQQMAALKGGKEEGNDHETKAPAGSVVTLDPRNGNVVAMASYPTYDPSEFVNGISTDRYEQLKGTDPVSDPFSNRAIQGQYAPGSTFKLVTATAALQDGLISGGTSYTDNGTYKLSVCKTGNTAPGCIRRNSGSKVNGPTNMAKSLTVSSDVFYYWLGDRFFGGGPQNGIQDTARAYGLGSDTGIPLPFEQDGFIPDPATLEQRHPNEEPYKLTNNVDTAIGQGFVLVTPLQLANAYATFANHGTVYQPNIVSRILKANSDPWDPASTIRTIDPVVKNTVDLPPGVYDPILQGLMGVPASGTAAVAFNGFDLRAFPIAGKTGTAQVNGKADTSVFAAFGPVGAPAYTTVAVLEESGFGANAAAPLVRRVFETVAGQTPQAAVTPVASGQAD